MSVFRRARRQAGTIVRWRPSWLMRARVNRFHQLYYDLGHRHGGTWRDTSWFGVTIWKNPLDVWIYQEILADTRPEVIIETGTAQGGSALFFAMMCDLLGTGEVISVDIAPLPGRPQHERIRYLHGSSTDPEVVAAVAKSVRNRERVMVLLDSDHSRGHVLRELEAYSAFVTEGCYLVVEDTNVNGHPVLARYGPGPLEAVNEFLERHPHFERDKRREKLLFTFNPGGYLRRKQSEA
ncbi:MAG: CmcI family methyltransferase [Actinomycetota bacterium]